MNILHEVYVNIDSENFITGIYSDWELTSKSNAIKIDDGFGDKYSHAQNNYFPIEMPLKDSKGIPNYKYENNKVVELTEEEKLKFFPVQEKELTETEILQKQLLETQAIVANLQEQILLSQNGGK
ncbi:MULTISPECIES: hypothetical protein [unclassified Clostridium]|uniref:hypothetical protein n=1 Tax=unclassified Clostridium TaxID=2614128 RepID=UPI0005FB4D40|nr:MULTISPECIES: hypothetical protein [unclassified Clostridium]KJZ94919.1 hypothetical protein ClosIBUN22A_CONTIG137g02718 [Clostridium sp. IBUN22A]KJZ95414.1 hypothetical protein ClosIBUN62F_CONTIG14g00758 [Clostridium sp. IBUN62F]